MESVGLITCLEKVNKKSIMIAGAKYAMLFYISKSYQLKIVKSILINETVIISIRKLKCNRSDLFVFAG